MFYISLLGEIFVFKNMSITQIAWKICEFIDRGLLYEDDMLNFVDYVYYNMEPSCFIELCKALTK